MSRKILGWLAWKPDRKKISILFFTIKKRNERNFVDVILSVFADQQWTFVVSLLVFSMKIEKFNGSILLVCPLSNLRGGEKLNIVT